MTRAFNALALVGTFVAVGCGDAQPVIRPAAGDSLVVAVIGPAGAVVKFLGVAQLHVRAGAFEAPESVTVWLSSLPSTTKGLEYYYLGRGGVPPYLPQDMTVRATTQPRLELEVEFKLQAASMACDPADFAPRVFRVFVGGGSMEALDMYQALPSTIDADAQTISALVIAPPVEQGTQLDEVFHVGCFPS